MSKKIEIPKKELLDYYIEKKLSTYQIADIYKCSMNPINRLLREYNIPLRDCHEGKRLRVNHFKMNDTIRDMIYGQLLGDGCISTQSSCSAFYCHSSKYENYVRWLSKEFLKHNIEQNGRIYSRCSDSFKTGRYQIGWHYATKHYAELKEIYDIFYINKKKIVPRDLKFSPLMVREWYVGDGYLATRKSRFIELYTNCFDREDLEVLIKEFNNINIKPTLIRNNVVIRIGSNYVEDFLEYIGDCPKEISMYSYKFKRD